MSDKTIFTCKAYYQDIDKVSVIEKTLYNDTGLKSNYDIRLECQEWCKDIIKKGFNGYKQKIPAHRFIKAEWKEYYSNEKV